MGPVLSPGTKLTFPNDTATDRIRIPRSNQLLDLHVDATQDVQREILFVDEVRDVGGELLIEQKRDAIVRSPDDAEIDELLTSPGFVKLDHGLVASRSLVHTIDVAASKDHRGLRARLPIARPIEIEFDNVVKRFFDILGGKSAREVVGRRAPL